MKEKNKIYTTADFSRYHSGKMSDREMHALELAALEDPFLSDALEGYAYTQTAKNDIEEIQEQLNENRKNKNVFFLSLARHGWWRIAALFMVIAGTGYFFYWLNDPEKAENSLVLNKTNIATEKDNSNLAIESDTAPAPDISSEEQLAAAFEQKGERILDKKINEAPVIMQQESNTASSLPGNSKNIPDAKSAYNEKAKENDTIAKTEYVLKGQVITEAGEPIPYAKITDEIHNKGTVADANGQFLLSSTDSSMTAKASALGYESKNFNLSKDSQPEIIMMRNGATLNEVVVTGMGIQRRKKESVSKQLKGKVSGIDVSDKPVPSEGLDKFHQYLNNNTPPVYDENGERLNGEVLLSFSINKKGKPENIKVVSSSCAACEEEAIKLLRNGPEWTDAKNKQLTAVIKFK